MTLYYNKTSEKGKRRFLRSHMTRPEVSLWLRLKGRQILGYKFRRQYSVGAFVLDFYCPALKLAIEIDGESHDKPKARESDRERQEYIEQFGIRFIRFKNDDVENHLEEVITSIQKVLNKSEMRRGLRSLTSSASQC